MTKEQFAQTAVLVHFLHNVAAADELAFNVDLRDRRPVGEDLDLVPHLLVRKHVHVFELLNPVGLHQHNHESTEAALGHLLGSFHEHDHVVLSDPLRESFVELVVGDGQLRFSLEIRI